MLLSGFALLSYRGLRDAEIAKLDARLEVFAGKVQAEFEEEHDKEPLRVLEIFLAERKTDGSAGINMRFFDQEGKLILRDTLLALSSLNPIGEVLNGSTRNGFLQVGGENFRYFWSPVEVEERVRYVLQLAAPMKEVELTLRYWRLLFLVSIPLALLITALASSLITRIAFRPMRGMVETAKQISGTTLHQRLKLPDAQDEVRLLGETLNNMMGRIDAAFKSQKQFIADASHEIRTPLTVISNELEFAEKRATDKAVRESIQISLAEIDRLARMSEGMLLLARLDASPEVLRIKQTRLDELLIECVQLVRGIAAKKEIKIKVSIEEAIESSADSERLKSVFLNLLENAVKYSNPKSSVSAKLSLNKSLPRRALLVVEDHGSGIAASDIPHLFKRFYRAEEARSGAVGSGLGLAIAERVVRLHGGTISVQSEKGKGSVFTVELPCT
jgi:Signal transduction histidine kinase